MKEMWKNSAIIAKRNVDDSQNPISVQLTELKQIIDVHSCIVLNQLPDEFHGINIEGYTEVHDIEKVSGKKFKVDYANGVLYFHPNNIGKMINVSYYGIGFTLLSASRIYTKYDKYGNVLETLEELIDKAKLYLKAIESLGGAVEVIRKLDEDITTGTTLHENLSSDIEVGTPLQINLRKDINEANTFRTQLNKDVATGVAIKDELKQNTINAVNANSDLIASNDLASSNINLLTKAGNYIGTITSSQWTGTEGNYEYSIKHDLNSEAIVINVIDTVTKEPLQPTCVFVDKNNILLKSDTKRGVKVVLSASYYSGGIDSKLELIDARKGKENLKAKIDDIDTQLEQIPKQLRINETKFTAHRGLNNAYPENTLLSFEMACLSGYKVIELDIQPTSDNILVVHHDLTVDRMTNGTGNVTSFTLSQIKTLNIDGGFGANEYPNIKIPTLEETLILLRKYNVRPMIELKLINSYSQLDILIALLKRYGFEHNSSIISSVTYLIDEFRKRGGKSECLLLNTITNDNTLLLISYGNCGYCSDYTIVTEAIINDLHNDGLTIAVYTVNDPIIAIKLRTWGADYITTDTIKGVF